MKLELSPQNHTKIEKVRTTALELLVKNPPGDLNSMLYCAQIVTLGPDVVRLIARAKENKKLPHRGPDQTHTIRH